VKEKVCESLRTDANIDSIKDLHICLKECMAVNELETPLSYSNKEIINKVTEETFFEYET
jgi:hypothetical protein